MKALILSAAMLAILYGCAQIPTPDIGIYKQTLTVKVAEDCGRKWRGWYYRYGEDKAFICIERDDWFKIYKHEMMHTAIDLFGWEQPESHRMTKGK